MDFAQLDDLVGQVVANISGYTNDGTRVATLLPNDLAFVCLIHALARRGAILVPLNTRLSGDEMSWQLERADCSVLVIDNAAADRLITEEI